MERKISVADLQKAVDNAYEAVKSLNEGEIDPRNTSAKANQFGIAVALPDGTVYKKGDVDVKVPMGAINKVALSTILFSQNKPLDLIKKSGACPMHKKGEKPVKPEGIHFSAHGIRAFSAVEPTGDPESKWNLYEGRMIDLAGSAPELDVDLYEKEKKNAPAIAKSLEDAGYYLYDDTALSIDLYQKSEAIKASAEQLALMGATIAADGVNAQGKIVFDGAITQNVVALMAAKGPHKINRPWLVATGLPAKASFGGTILGIIPGVMSVAVYGPELTHTGVSVKGLKAVISLMQELDISIFASAKPVFVK